MPGFLAVPGFDVRTHLKLRVFAIALIAIGVALLPDIGPGRWLVAGAMLFALVPFIVVMEYRYPNALDWAGPLPDILSIVIFVHVGPQFWDAGMAIGLIIALSPSTNNLPHAHRVFAFLGAVLVAGLAFAGWLHEVPRWEVTTAFVVAMYPAILFHARRLETRRHALVARTNMLANLHLIAGSVAHTFSNAMMAVSGNVELALARLGDDDPARRFLLEAHRNSTNAGEMSKQLASFAGRGPAEPRPIPVADEVQTVVSLMRLVIPDTFSLRLIPSHASGTVLGNRFDLQQVLVTVINLMMTGPGREISVQCVDGEHLSVELVDPTVRDPRFVACESGAAQRIPGFGVLPEQLLVFDPDTFGIELAGHAGRLAAIRVTLRGTVTRPQEKLAIDTTARTRRRVLIIDDDEGIRSTVAAMLRALDCDPLVAASGQEGLDVLRVDGNSISHVILDLKMPGMDGWECLERIREHKPWLPVTIASGYDPGRERATSFDNVNYLQKPFGLSHIKGVLV